jgi:hypothetical protein
MPKKTKYLTYPNGFVVRAHNKHISVTKSNHHENAVFVEVVNFRGKEFIKNNKITSSLTHTIVKDRITADAIGLSNESAFLVLQALYNYFREFPEAIPDEHKIK